MLKKIISGAQTGADRAALDWAIASGFAHGGWCPCERKAEDGVIDAKYQLQETVSDNYRQRTRYNVEDSDGKGRDGGCNALLGANGECVGGRF
jgi:hypothetical protein